MPRWRQCTACAAHLAYCAPTLCSLSSLETRLLMGKRLGECNGGDDDMA
jgi:hypothetical protein